MLKSLKNRKGMTAEQLSTRVLYVLVALTVVVFALFFAVGYDRPYSNDPQFNDPLFTDAVLWFIYILVVGACCVAVFSLARAFKRRDGADDVINNLPAAKIKYITFGLLFALLTLTFLFGSTEPVLVNGVKYTDTLWLKLTDMFLNTSLALFVVAALGVAFGLSGHSRKLVLKGKRPTAEEINKPS